MQYRDIEDKLPLFAPSLKDHWDTNTARMQQLAEGLSLCAKDEHQPVKSDTSLRTGKFPSCITVPEIRLHIDFKTHHIEKSEQEALPIQKKKGNHNHSSNLTKRNKARAHLCCHLDIWNHLNSSSSVTPVRDISKSDYLRQKGSVSTSGQHLLLAAMGKWCGRRKLCLLPVQPHSH